MTRRMTSVAGAMLLAGLGGWISPTFAQGPMAPRMDVAPPPARVAPPPPPVFVPPPVAPTPPMAPVAPVMTPPPPPDRKAPTASAPAIPTPATPAPLATPAPVAPTPPTASPATPRATATAPPPYTDSQVKALRGVGVGVRAPGGGTRQVTSDSNGVVSLGKLGPGRHELTVNPRSLGTGPQPGAQPVALVGLLLPAVQKLRDGEPRYRTVVLKPVNDPPTLRVRIDVDANGQVSTVDPGNGIGVNVAAGDVNGDGRADIKLFEDLAKRNTSGETRLVFVAPVPGSNAAALADANNILQEVSTTRLGTSPGNPAGPGKPNPNYVNNPIPGVDIIVEKNPGGKAAKQATNGDGTSTLGVLTPGTHSLKLDTKKLLDVRIPGPSGGEPVQPAGILIGLLLPAVQKLGEAPQPTTVEHAFPRSVLANAKELRIDVVIPDGGGSPKVNWGDGSPTTDVGRDGVPVSSALRVSADVSTIRVQNYLSSPQTGPGGTAQPTANEAPINTTRSNIKRPSLEIAAGEPDKTSPNYTNKPIPGVDIIVEKNPGGKAAQQATNSDGTSTLGVLTPGTHSLKLDTNKLLDVRTPGPSGGEPAQPAGILIGLLLPAVQKLGEAPQPTTVEHAFPRSFLANAKELRIDIVVPDGGGSPKVNWGDGSPTTDVGRDGVPVSSALRVSADVSTIRVQNYLSSPQTGPGGPATPTANEAAISTSRSNIKRPSVMLPDVGVTTTGPGGVMQVRSDGGGWTRLGKLAVGNTMIEFSGTDLASALKKTGTPLTPTPQQNHIELLVVIAIIAIKTDGTPVAFTGSVPASAVKSLKADLRIGRDGNAMEANWGNGQQLPQILPRTGAASLTVPGPNGPIPLDPEFVKSLQDRAVGSAPGLVESSSALQEVSTTR